MVATTAKMGAMFHVEQFGFGQKIGFVIYSLA